MENEALIEETQTSIVNFTEDLKETTIKFVCILYFIIGITLSFATISQELDLNAADGLNYLKIFIVLMIICQALNFAIIVYNRHISRKMPREIVKIKDHALLYFTIVPLMAIVVVYFIAQIMKFIENKNNYNIALTIFQFLFLISVVMLMVDQGTIKNNPNYFGNRLLNKAAILVTSVGLMISLVLYIIREELGIFKCLTYEYYNISTCNDTEKETLIFKTNTFLFPIHIAFLAMSIGYLLGAFYQNFNHSNVNVDSLNFNIEETNFRIPFNSILFGIFLIVLPIISIIVINTLKKPGHLTFYVFTCVVYLVGIILSIIQIKDIKNWEKISNNESFVDRFLIWVGCFGQIIFAINNISMACQFETLPKNLLIDKAIYILLGITSVFLIIQIALQSIIINLAVSRKIKIPEENTAAKIFCPSVGLLCLNIGCLILITMSPFTTIQQSKIMSVDLFHNGMNIIALCFTLIHRLHGSVFFALLLNKYHQ